MRRQCESCEIEPNRASEDWAGTGRRERQAAKLLAISSFGSRHRLWCGHSSFGNLMLAKSTTHAVSKRSCNRNRLCVSHRVFTLNWSKNFALDSSFEVYADLRIENFQVKSDRVEKKIEKKTYKLNRKCRIESNLLDSNQVKKRRRNFAIFLYIYIYIWRKKCYIRVLCD